MDIAIYIAIRYEIHTDFSTRESETYTVHVYVTILTYSSKMDHSTQEWDRIAVWVMFDTG